MYEIPNLMYVLPSLICFIQCFIYLCHFLYGTCQFQYMSHDNSSCVVCLNLYMLHHYPFMLHVVF